MVGNKSPEVSGVEWIRSIVGNSITIEVNVHVFTPESPTRGTGTIVSTPRFGPDGP